MNWTIQCWAGKALISKVIEWEEWTPFSHVSINNGHWSWEATTPRVRCIELEQLLEEQAGIQVAELTFKVELSRAEEDALISFLYAHVGDRYAIGALLRFLTRARVTADPDDHEWICSEYVHAACKAAGRALQDRIPSEKVDPGRVFTSPLLALVRYGTYIKTLGAWQFVPDPASLVPTGYDPQREPCHPAEDFGHRSADPTSHA